MLPHLIRLWLVLSAAAVALVFCVLSASRLTSASAREALSYVSNDRFRRGIYLMDLRSRLVHSIVNSPHITYRSPNWSPDGRWLAFVAEQDGRRQLFAAEVEGGRLYALTDHDREDFSPAWSPDSLSLAFVSNRGGQHDIYSLKIHALAEDGVFDSQVVNLTASPNNEYEPAWSPRGGLLAFVSDRDRQRDIFILEIESGALRNLTDHQAEDFSPAWSPDGRRLAFVSDRSRNYEIFLYNLDTERAHNLTRSRAEEWFPIWSPNGTYLAFVSDRAGSYEVYVLNVETGRLRNLTRSATNDFAPVWSPDGSRIAFVSNRGPTQQIYLTEVECGTIPEKCSRQITISAAENSMPLWRP